MRKEPCVDPQIASFAARYPWPLQCPAIAANERHGWLSVPTAELLASVLNEKTQLVVELGSWLGLSTRFIADRAPSAMVIAVDHWQGSPEHQEDPELRDLLPVLYETFLSSCWRYRNRIIPMRMNAVDALGDIARHNLRPDVIYLDADHTYEAVRADVERIRSLFPEAILVGDDWDWEGVRLAVSAVAEAQGAKIGIHGCAWRFCDAATLLALGARPGRG